jgi:hybrid cluster-associated redox disulfide protein
MEITKEMKIGDAVNKKPEAAEVMVKYGLHCVGCGAAVLETIEQGAKLHGMDDEKIEKMMKEINEK